MLLGIPATSVARISVFGFMSFVPTVVNKHQEPCFRPSGELVRPHLEGCPFWKPVISDRRVSKSAAALEGSLFPVNTECTDSIYALVIISYFAPATTEGRATTVPPCWFGWPSRGYGLRMTGSS